MNNEKSELEGLLGDIHSVLLKDLLEDLKNPKKRTPQLYNAVIKELELSIGEGSLLYAH